MQMGAGRISVYRLDRRTNNVVESFNAAMLRLMRVTHPRVWEFLSKQFNCHYSYMKIVCVKDVCQLRLIIHLIAGKLIKLEATTLQDFERVSTGGNIAAPKKTRYLDNSRRIVVSQNDVEAERIDVYRFLLRMSYADFQLLNVSGKQ